MLHDPPVVRPGGRSSCPAAATLVAASGASAIGPQVIYTEIASHSSSLVPGARDAVGNPAVTTFLSLQELAMRHDGGEWMIKGQTSQGTTLDAILIRGSGKIGTAFAQDGQPVQGGAAGELYDFFDSPVPAAWDDAGNIAFSFRARGGVSTRAEKIARVVGGVHTLVIQQGDPALGLIDNPPANSGDETFGNSMNSCSTTAASASSIRPSPTCTPPATLRFSAGIPPSASRASV
jgi:hypothetical protein